LAFSLIQHGSTVKTSTIHTKKVTKKFEAGLRKLSDAALLSAFNAKSAAMTAMEVENRLWILKAEEYRTITEYMKAMRDMVNHTLQHPRRNSEDGQGEQNMNVKELMAEKDFYSERVKEYQEITMYMDVNYYPNKDSLAALDLQIESIGAHLRARSGTPSESYLSPNEMDPPSGSDPIVVGELEDASTPRGEHDDDVASPNSAFKL